MLKQYIIITKLFGLGNFIHVQYSVFLFVFHNSVQSDT